jgi:ABC-type Fe3+ transport system substrate-binding protein
MIRRYIATSALAAGLTISGLASADASQEWQDLVEAAKAEGSVSVIAGGNTPRSLRPVIPKFEEKYGIEVNYQTGSGRQHAERILAERNLGSYTVDVWMGGANTPLTRLMPNGALAPIKGNNVLLDPEVTDTSNWFQGQHFYTDPEHKYIFTWGASPSQVVVINTDMVDPEEIQSYHDLLNPKWKGKMVSTSPGATGSGATTAPMVLNEKIGLKWFERLASEMNVTIIRDQRQGAEWVAVGRYPIGLFGMSSEADKLAEEGFPIQSWLPAMEEGEALTASAANIMLMDKAPNPNAAKLFINWALTQETQKDFINASARMDSLRVDVSNEGVLPPYRLDRDADYFVAFASDEYINKQDEILVQLQEIMREAGY